MQLVKATLAHLSNNRASQKLLEKVVQLSQFLQGIGSGTEVESSGERSVLKFMRRHLASPYCIFDVGANEGQYLHLLTSSFLPTEINVHCFEPGRETFQTLASKVAEPYRNVVRLNNLALGKEPGELSLFYDAPGSGLASLTKRRLDHFGIQFERSEVVIVETLDNYCQTHQIERIHLLKLDVEGHELDVLAGADSMFSKRAIDLVAFEFGGCNIDTRTFVQDFYYFFRDNHMTLCRIAPSGFLHPMPNYREIYEQFRTTNFVAIKNS